MSTPTPKKTPSISALGNQAGMFDVMAVILGRAVRPTQRSRGP